MSIHEIIYLPVLLLIDLGFPSVLLPFFVPLYLLFAYGLIFSLPLLFIASVIGNIRDKFSSSDSFDKDSLSNNYFHSDSIEDSEFNLDEFRRTHTIKKNLTVKKKTISKSRDFKKEGWDYLK